jgi:hypothetical protein
MKMKKQLLTVMLSAGLLTIARSQKADIAYRCNVQIDGSKKFQQIDGFGVNANTRSWKGNELMPALNLLIDSLQP